MTEQQVATALAHLKTLVASAKAVVQNWERGDLAGAVNILEADADAAEEFIKEVA
jgi:hypothetical protein